MSKGPIVIQRGDVSHAWAAALHEASSPGSHEIAPLVVCITGFDNSIVRENPNVRVLVDDALRARGMQSVRTVANTIFPFSLWNPLLPADALFTRYCRLATKLRKYKLNRNGIYFERMVKFNPKGTETAVNQLEYILSTREGGNHRRSAYQLSVLDPTQDHTNQRRRGFPCLQQVSITPLENSELAITGFYATQTMVEKAYGNYIGLCDLGRFFAHYWDMHLTKVTCVTSLAQLDIGKTDARELASTALSVIDKTAESVITASEG